MSIAKVATFIKNVVKDCLKVALLVVPVMTLVAAVIPDIGFKSSAAATAIITTMLGILNAFITWAQQNNVASRVLNMVGFKR